MARRLRIQYPGALYHIINRGNFRRDVFESAGAAQAFESALGEACLRHGWIIHAFATMRNHFHLALETPDPNLVQGMHWLESTYATRFNRFRDERGHLFQGRYQSILVEDDAALSRVVDYIHLNPVIAKLVATDQMADFRWSSLGRYVKGRRPSWLEPGGIVRRFGSVDTSATWKNYISYLRFLAVNPTEQERLCFSAMERGWAIGTLGWRRAIAREYSQKTLFAGLPQAEVEDLRVARWETALETLLARWRKTREDLVRDAKGIRWKIELALRLRLEAGASYRWLTCTLQTISPAALRVAVCRLANM